MIKISEEEYQEHVDNYDGVCLACGEWTCGGVEPDAEKYLCEYCEKNEVCGAEEALLMGEIEFEE